MKLFYSMLLVVGAMVGYGSFSSTSIQPAAAAETTLSASLAPVPATYADTYVYSSVCPKPAGGRWSGGDVDKWNFYKCECVSYVAYKLNSRGIPFNNTYLMPKGQRWGDASKWLSAAKTAKIKVDNSPTAGSIVTFSYGHVAYVEYVYSDGGIDISEYNYTPAYRFNTRTIKKKDFAARSISGFIHF